jgi:hypothetical protein
MARSIDFLISYRIFKGLVTPFERTKAFKYGIVDNTGKVLRKSKTLKTTDERNAYTLLDRFIFNLKKIMKKVGLGGRLGSLAATTALFIKENKEFENFKPIIESAIISYLKETKQYDNLLNEQGEVKPVYEQEPFMTCFGIDVYEKDGELYPEDKYENL